MPRSREALSMIRRPVVLLAVAASLALAGDWTPPKDGVMTEKQVDAYIAGSEKSLDVRDAYLKWLGEHKDASTLQLGEQLKKFDADFEKAKRDTGLANGEWE